MTGLKDSALEQQAAECLQTFVNCKGPQTRVIKQLVDNKELHKGGRT